MAPTELANAVDVTLMQSDADVMLQNEAKSCSSVVPAGVFNGTIRFNFRRRYCINSGDSDDPVGELGTLCVALFLLMRGPRRMRAAESR